MNTYTRGTTINGGVLQFGTGAGAAVPTTAGGILINSGGALAATGPSGYANAGAWAASGLISTSSSGALAIAGNDSSAVNFKTPGLNNLYLGATGAFTYSGNLTPGSNGYLLGGGGGVLTVSSLLSGANALTVNGNVVLSGNNTYSGATTIIGGDLQAVDGVGLPASSNLVFNGNVAATGMGAVFQGSGTFSRALGTGAGQVQWTGDGGFAANGSPLTVNIPNGGNPLVWGSTTNFLATGAVLTFGSPTANNQVNFTNSIDLSGGTSCGIFVAAGAGGDSALISGNVIDSVGGAILTKSGGGELIVNNILPSGNLTLASGGGAFTVVNTITVPNTFNLTLAPTAGAGMVTLGSVQFSGTAVGNPRAGAGAWTNTLLLTSATGTIVSVGNLGAGPGVLDNGGIDLQNGSTLRITGSNNLGGFMVLGTDNIITTDPGQYGTTLQIASDSAFGTASTVYARNVDSAATPWDQSVYAWNGVIQGVGGPHTLSGRHLTIRGNITFNGDDLTFAGPAFVRSNGSHTLFVDNTTTFADGLYQQSAGQSVIKDGPGTLIVGGTTSTLTWTGGGNTYGPFSTYTNGTTVQAGTLQWATAYAIPTSGTVQVASGATLALNVGGPNEAAKSDLDRLLGNTTFASGGLLGLDTTNAAGGSFNYSSDISGGMTLAKLGPKHAGPQRQ